MNARLLTALIVVLIPIASLMADEPKSMKDILSEESLYKCNDFRYNATLLVPRLYEEGKIDSINQILEFLDEQCGLKSAFMFARILMHVEEGTFSEEIYDSAIVYSLTYHRELIELRQENGALPWWSAYSQDPESSERYYDFLQDVADKLLPWTVKGSVERLWCMFLSNDFLGFYHELKTPAYGTSDLYEYHYRYVRYVKWDRNSRERHMGIILGYWVPSGNHDFLGNKIQLGGVLGWGAHRWQFDMPLILRVGKSKERYVVETGGIKDTTDSYFGGSLGFDGLYHVHDEGSNRVGLLAGLGYDFTQTVKDRGKEEDAKKVLHSFNLNTGVRYQFFLDRMHRWYVGITARYNILWYDNKGGTDWSGNAITLNLNVGRCADSGKNHILRLLGYYDD